MLIAVVFLLIGIVLLTFAADHFVEGAATLAVRMRLSPVVVGAMIIGFGTSLPEMIVSGIAAGSGDRDLGVGNIIGSNIANLSLVLGVSGLILAIGVSTLTLRRELPLSFGSVVLFAVLMQNGISRQDAAVLIVVMLSVLFLLVRPTADDATDYEPEFADLEEGGSTGTEVVRTLVGLVGTVGGAYLLVEGATTIADSLGLSDGFVGLTMVAIGTSLPELVTAIVACRKGHTDLIVGNLLGSNIFNSLAVGAVIGFVGPGPVLDPNLTGLAAVVMVVIALLAGIFMITGERVVAWEAVVLLAVYLLSIPFTAGGIDCDAADLNAEQIADCAEKENAAASLAPG